MFLYKKNCMRCGSSWDSRKDDPKYCPKCKSPGWNRPVSQPTISAASKARQAALRAEREAAKETTVTA